jgi:16S rRNA (uracil1498-N3)-methyltransferase
MPRFLVDLKPQTGLELPLSGAVARHLQVLRLQPGAAITLFDGSGQEWAAEVLRIARSEVWVRVDAVESVDRELPVSVQLAIGMPANERMDWLVEKATELGVTEIQPLVCDRSVLRLDGERAERKRVHWQAVAGAAAEQCGRNRLPLLHPVRRFEAWLPSLLPSQHRFVLSLGGGAQPLIKALASGLAPGSRLLFLSGPEGGLSPAEDHAARLTGLAAVSLGPRVLRAETAAIAALAAVAAIVA